jgi:vesicle coat complex subunit
LGEKEEVIKTLLLRLADKDEDSSVRGNAALALGNLGNTSVQVRRNAALALGKLGKNSNDFASAVVKWISQHQDSEYIGSGIDALWELVATDG